MLETQAERRRREFDSMARLMRDVRADPMVRPPQARSEHFATAFSNNSATVFVASCRCGWKGQRYVLTGERPFANWRVNDARGKAQRDADEHNRGGNEAA